MEFAGLFYTPKGRPTARPFLAGPMMHNCQHPYGCSQLRMDSPTAGKQSTGLFSDPPFESASHTKKETVHSDGLFFGARDGTRTHTAKPHAPQTCLSTIPTLSQSVLKYYSGEGAFCQHFFMLRAPFPDMHILNGNQLNLKEISNKYIL